MRSSGSIQIVFYLCLISALSLLGCQRKEISEIKMKELPTETHITKIVYHFEDASVPPQYHRSYTITVTPDRVKIVVNSYGEILAEKDYDIRTEQFLGVVHSLTVNNISMHSLGENKGCTGGTGEGISYWDEHGEIFSATVYHCGGIDSGDLAGNVYVFAAHMKTLIPDLHDLLK